MNRRNPVNAQVHRFREAVAVYVGTGETVYISPREARKLARALQAVARSCDREGFAQSTAGTHQFSFGDVG